MTLPVLIQKQNNTIAETRLKKFYSVFNQAILMSVKDNGDFENWNYWAMDKKDENGDYLNQNELIQKNFESYLEPYLKITDKKKVINEAGQEVTMYYLADGSAFKFAERQNRDISFYPKNAENCIKKYKDGEHTVGVCMFEFVFNPVSSSVKWKYHYKKGLEPNLYLWDGNESSLYDANDAGCNFRGAYCTGLIQHNGWRIPKDYPRKISY